MGVHDRAFLPLFAAALLLSALPQAVADPATQEPPGGGESLFTLTYAQENDGPWVNRWQGTDRYYTHGVALALAHQPRWSRRLGEALPLAPDTFASGVAYTVAHRMYTPAELTARELPQDDRPYAGYASLTVALERSSRTVADTVALVLGAVGPVTRAGELQRFAHRNWGGREPLGWDTQVPNTPVIQAAVDRRWRFAAGEALSAQLIPTVGASFGTVHIRGWVTGALRLGMNLPESFGSTELLTLRSPTSRVKEGVGLYAEVGAIGELVGWNLLISGGPNPLAPEPLLGSLRFGGGITGGLGLWSLEVAYYQRVESERFPSQAGSHRYGSASASISRQL